MAGAGTPTTSTMTTLEGKVVAAALAELTRTWETWLGRGAVAVMAEADSELCLKCQVESNLNYS